MFFHCHIESFVIVGAKSKYIFCKKASAWFLHLKFPVLPVSIQKFVLKFYFPTALYDYSSQLFTCIFSVMASHSLM